MAMTIKALKMFWLTMTIFVGLAVLVAGDEMNTNSSASPKVQMSTTTTITTTSAPTSPPPPPFAAVMDIFQAPLAAFKPNVDDKTNLQMGRDQQSSAATPEPSNIFFKAGSGLGSAASSLTGWFNNRVIPQALRTQSTTTAAPEVMYQIIPNQQVKRKIILATENGRKPLRNRQRPVLDDLEDLEDDEEQFSNDENEDEEDDQNLNFDMVEGDEEDDYEPVEKRKGSKKAQKRPNKQYFYIEEEILDNDEDLEPEVQMPKRKPQRKQQNLADRRRKTPPKKKQQKRKKPVRRVQKPQRVQVVQNSPYQSQVKRKRRPSTYELVPISQNQAISSIIKKKPNSFTENNQQKPVSQFLNIPWSSLGLAGPPKDPNSNDQQSKPIIVRIPQQNIKRKRRPSKKQTASAVKNPKNPRRKPIRGQLQSQSPVFSILSDDEVREIFKTQLNEPSQTMPQASNSPMGTKKNPPKKENEEMSLHNNNNNFDNKQQDKLQAQSEAASNEEDTNDSYIVVGPSDDEDDKEIDAGLYRHYSNYRGFKRGRAEPMLSHSREGDHDYDDEP